MHNSRRMAPTSSLSQLPPGSVTSPCLSHSCCPGTSPAPSTPTSMLQTRASASETNGNHSLLLLLLVSSLLPCSSHSLSLYSLVPLVISFLVFYPLSFVFFTDVHTGIVPRSWSNRKQSLTPSVVAGYGNEREREGEGKVRRLRRKGDTQVTFYFSFVLSYTDCMGWSDTPTWCHKASEGRRACGGWYSSREYLF